MHSHRLSAEVRAAVKWLRKNYPVKRSVIVKMAARMECRGLCTYDDERALIRLRSGEGESTTDTLIEEWSHLLRAECPLIEETEHDALFWAIYGHVSERWRGE